MPAFYQGPLDLLFWGLALAWTVFTLTRVVAMRGVSLLPTATALATTTARAGSRRRVSVIVTARNEERRIEHTVHRLLAQDGIDVELVVVDDRSTDATPRIVTALAAEHPEIRHERIETLPPGWLGKTHACRVGAATAAGDWLLFTDADGWMAPDLVARAVAVAVRDDAEHVCLLPREHELSFFGGATHTFLAVLVSPLMSRLNRGARGAFAGVGAFNLVRADAYRASGGHEELKLTVVDDLGLGLLLYRAGYRSRVYEAYDDLGIEWAPSARGVVRAVEKNLFAALGFSVPLAVLAILGAGAFWCSSVVGPFTGRLSGIVAGSAFLASALPGLGVARRTGYGALAATFSPLMLPVLLVAIANSTIKTLARGGVRWRDTFYPLSVLAPDGVWRVSPPGLREVLFAPKPPRASRRRPR